MWIKSQDQKLIIDVNSIKIERNYGSKKKRAIVGVHSTLNLFHSNAVVLGLYYEKQYRR